MAKRIEVVLALLIAIACGAASASTTPVITVNYPVNGSTVKGPVYYAASASTSCAKGIAAMRIYSAPNVPAYTVNAAQFSTFLKLAAGSYNTVVQAWDNCGGVGKTPISVTVSSAGGVTVYMPANGASVNSPIHFVASATATASCSKGIAAIRIYSAVSVKAYTVYSNKLDTFLSLPQGTYSSTIQAWDHCGGVYKTPVTLVAQNSSGRFLYVATGDLGYLSEFVIDPSSGALTPSSHFPVAGSYVQQVVADPAGKFAFAIQNEGVLAYKINPNSGALTLVPGSPFPVISPGNAPLSLTMDPQGNFVYVGFRNSNLASYRIDRNSGALKVNEIANLLPGATANAVRTDASGRFVYVADSTNSGLYGFVVNRRTGGFTATIGSPFSSGLGPSVLSTSNNFLYVYNNAQSADIAAYWISPNSGVLTAVPGSPFTGKNYPAHYIAVDSAHNVLYQPAFGPSSSTISVYTVEPSTGVITFKGFTAQYQEIRAETLLPDFSGKYLYLVGAYDGTERSDVAVSSFTIDPATGNLALATGPLRVASPNHYSSLAVSP